MKKYLVIIFTIFLTFSSLFSMSEEEKEAVNNQKLIVHSFIGNFGVVEELLKKDIDVNVKDDKRNTPLHLAILGISQGPAEKRELRISNALKIVNALLNYSVEDQGSKTYPADINAQNNEGVTPLHLACQNGYLSIVKALLENENHKIDVNIKDIIGWVPLCYAILSQNKDIINLLVKHPGINLNVKDKVSNTPLHYAIGNPEFVKILSEARADLNLQNNDGQTPLYQSASLRDSESVKVLMEKGANPNIKDNIYSLAPIHIAALRFDKDYIKIIRYLCTIKPETKKEAELSTNDIINLQTGEKIKKFTIRDKEKKEIKNVFKGGETALHLAAYIGNKEAVRLLLSLGIDYSIKNNDGKTAQDLAQGDVLEVFKSLVPKLPEMPLDKMISAIRDLNISLEVLSSRLNNIKI